MTLTLSAPSKTFMAGEYAVLAGGPALVLNTGPRFELNVVKGGGSFTGIPSGSPAGKWYEQRAPLLRDFDVTFVDPHKGAGGLGASGAQFLLLHTLTTFLQSSFEKTLDGPSLRDVWNDQQALSGGRGSGADVLAQAVGQVAQVRMQAQAATAKPWPYPEIAWTIVRTHQKIPTHEHLEMMDRQNLSLLVPPANACVEAFGEAPPEVFIGHLKAFAQRLKELGLLAAHSQSVIRMLEAEEWCLAAKGCGALGADTVLFFYPQEARERVNTFLRKSSLQAVAGLGDLSGGMEIRWH